MDVILENRKQEVVGVGVKASATVSEPDFKGLRVLRESLGKRLRCGVVPHPGREAAHRPLGLWALPVQALWGV